MRSLIPAAALLAALVLPAAASAQSTIPHTPVAVPIVQTVPDAEDTPYPGGTIRLDVDASDTQHGAYRVTETIPLVNTPEGSSPGSRSRFFTRIPISSLCSTSPCASCRINSSRAGHVTAFSGSAHLDLTAL